MPIEYTEEESKKIVDDDFRFLCNFLKIPFIFDPLLDAASVRLLSGLDGLSDKDDIKYTKDTLKAKLKEICKTNGSITTELGLGAKVTGITGEDMLHGLVKFIKSPTSENKPKELEIKDEKLNQIQEELNKPEVKQMINDIPTEVPVPIAEGDQVGATVTGEGAEVPGELDQPETSNKIPTVTGEYETVVDAADETVGDAADKTEKNQNSEGGKRLRKRKTSKKSKRISTPQKKISKMTRVNRPKKTKSQKPRKSNKTRKYRKRV